MAHAWGNDGDWWLPWLCLKWHKHAYFNYGLQFVVSYLPKFLSWFRCMWDDWLLWHALKLYALKRLTFLYSQVFSIHLSWLKKWEMIQRIFKWKWPYKLLSRIVADLKYTNSFCCIGYSFVTRLKKEGPWLDWGQVHMSKRFMCRT